MKNKEHKTLRIKGVEVDGLVNEFCEKLLNVGFELAENKYVYGKELKGTFLGVEDSEFGLCSFPETNLIHRVDISMPIIYSYDRPISKYFRIKNLLSEEYGKPVIEDDIIEKYRYLPNDEIDKKIKDGDLRLYCKFCIDVGWVDMLLSNESLGMTMFNLKNYEYSKRLLLEKEMELEIKDIKQ